MSAAAYNRGSRIVSRGADERMPVALDRADKQATKDEIARLRGQVAELELELRRARRCLAAERAGREALPRALDEIERLRTEISVVQQFLERERTAYMYENQQRQVALAERDRLAKLVEALSAGRK